MKKVISFVLMVLMLTLIFLFPFTTHHPLSIFILREMENGRVEALKLEFFFSEKNSFTQAIQMSASQEKEGTDILKRLDVADLENFSKGFMNAAIVIGVPSGEGQWPEYLGDGFHVFFQKNKTVLIDNLQWMDRIYLSFFLNAPSPVSILTGENKSFDSNLKNSPEGVNQLIVPPTPVPKHNVVRVEILNGCGITNAADWIARRIQSPNIKVVDTGNADNFRYTKTLILTAAGVPVAIQEIAERLGIPEKSIMENPNLNPAIDATIIVGKDFSKLKGGMRERNSH